MAKNIQFKIVLIFFIIGITIISGLGIFYINSLNTIQAQIGEVTVNEIQQIINNAKKEMKESYKLEIVCDEPLMFKKIDIS